MRKNGQKLSSKFIHIITISCVIMAMLFPVFALNKEEKKYEIKQFKDANPVYEETVPQGTSKDQLKLPETLKAEVIEKTEDVLQPVEEQTIEAPTAVIEIEEIPGVEPTAEIESEPVENHIEEEPKTSESEEIDIPVTWVENQTYDADKPGVYTFIAKYDIEKYSFEGVEPQATVKVEEVHQESTNEEENKKEENKEPKENDAIKETTEKATDKIIIKSFQSRKQSYEMSEPPVCSIGIPTGVPEADLALPKTLKAKIDDNGTEKEIDVPVTWKCTRTYDMNVESDYTFTAQLDKNMYEYQGEMPQGSVVVWDSVVNLKGSTLENDYIHFESVYNVIREDYKGPIYGLGTGINYSTGHSITEDEQDGIFTNDQQTIVNRLDGEFTGVTYDSDGNVTGVKVKLWINQMLANMTDHPMTNKMKMDPDFFEGNQPVANVAIKINGQRVSQKKLNLFTFDDVIPDREYGTNSPNQIVYDSRMTNPDGFLIDGFTAVPGDKLEIFIDGLRMYLNNRGGFGDSNATSIGIRMMVEETKIPQAGYTIEKHRITKAPKIAGTDQYGFLPEDIVKYELVIENTGEMPLTMDVEDTFEDTNSFKDIRYTSVNGDGVMWNNAPANTSDGSVDKPNITIEAKKKASIIVTAKVSDKAAVFMAGNAEDDKEDLNDGYLNTASVTNVIGTYPRKDGTLQTIDSTYEDADGKKPLVDKSDTANTPVQGRLDFLFVKEDGETKIPLKDATFVLYSCTKDHAHAEVVSDTITDCWSTYKTITSDANGKVDFGKLPGGQYMLVEQTTPSPYQRPVGQWLITIDTVPDTKTPITIEAKGEYLPPAFYIEEGIYRLPNYKVSSLPMTGGSDMHLFTFIGIILMSASSLTYLYGKKRNRKKI